MSKPVSGVRNPITIQAGMLSYIDQFKSSNVGFGKEELYNATKRAGADVRADLPLS